MLIHGRQRHCIRLGEISLIALRIPLLELFNGIGTQIRAVQSRRHQLAAQCLGIHLQCEASKLDYRRLVTVDL